MKTLRKNGLFFFLRDQFLVREYFRFVFIASVIFGIFSIAPALKHYPVHGFYDDLLLTFSWLMITLFSGILIFFGSLNRWIFLVFFPLFMVLSGIISFYIYQYNVVLNGAVVGSTIYTNNDEAFSQISLFLFFYVLVLSGLSVFLVLKRWNLKIISIQWTRLLLLVLLVLLVGTLNRQHILKTMHYSPYALSLGLYEFLNDDDLKTANRQDISFGANCNTDSITVVFVVGEAMRADHVSLNGYHRETFPRMEQEAAVSFKNIYSEWTYTIKSLPHIFTRADSIHPLPARNEKTFISIFSACSFTTRWIGNQHLNKYLSPLAAECDSLQLFFFSDNNTRFDGQMLPAVKRAIAAPEARKLIVVHQFGCHWWYPANCPPEFEKFVPVMKSKSISRSDSLKIVNSYDNVAYYTDYFLGELVSMLKDKKALLIYLSDHGELLGENGKWIHAQQTEFEKNPACLFWFSESYAKTFPEKVEALKLNRDKHFRTDFLFHTLLDAGAIETPLKIDELSVLRKIDSEQNRATSK